MFCMADMLNRSLIHCLQSLAALASGITSEAVAAHDLAATGSDLSQALNAAADLRKHLRLLFTAELDFAADCVLLL